MTPEGPETATTPAIPAPRAPLDPPLTTAAPAPLDPPLTTAAPAPVAETAPAPVAETGEVPIAEWVVAEPQLPAKAGFPVGEWEPAASDTGEPPASDAGRRRKRVLLLATGTALAVLLIGFVVLRPDGKRDAAAIAAPSAGPASAAAPVTPYDRAVEALTEQSAALLRGDEAAWLSAVDPARSALRKRYRAVFRSLRALGVTRFEYRPGVGQPVKGAATAVTLRVDAAYCFGPEMCPDNPGSAWQQPPHITERLTLRPVKGRYLISARKAEAKPNSYEPLPWEGGELAVAQGKRVVLAAAPAQAKLLADVLQVAERAAVVDDKYAGLIGTAERRYRIFLAGEKQWKSWYGGDDHKWAIGVAVPLNMYGIDVVLRMADLTDPLVLRVTLQHELGHVVTLSGAYRSDAAEDTWLSEGIAEYIGWQPRSASGSLRRSSVRWALNRSSPPKSMVPVRPGDGASNRAGDAFYGLAHYAADCMAKKYGERKLFTFVRLVLTKDNTYDQAARDAYGASFATVDKFCVKWIRQQAA
jgi:hypothetical protein